MNNNQSSSVEKLLDFDWNIKQVIGSSSCRSIEDTLTQITFHTLAQSASSGTVEKKNTTIEFDKNELKNLITTLQSMKQN